MNSVPGLNPPVRRRVVAGARSIPGVTALSSEKLNSRANRSPTRTVISATASS